MNQGRGLNGSSSGRRPFLRMTLTLGGELRRSYLAGWSVPKVEIIGAVSVLLQTRRLLIPRGLPHAEVLVKELSTFQVKPPATREQTLESWREGPQDDLVLALA